MGKINSRNKGAAAEREFANYLKDRGYEDAARGQQHRGGGDSPDVIGLPGIHLELKRTERFALYDALDQARRDSSGTGKMPVVAHRCNGNTGPRLSCRGEWLAVLSFEDFLAMKQAADALGKIIGEMV